MDEKTSGSVDLAYVRRKIPIEQVGAALGLDIRGHFARCPRTENHPNGDENPSLHFLPRVNRAICFGCGDRRPFSNIDLVMAALGCNFPSAIAWLRERFDVPLLKGRPSGEIVRDRPYRAGTGGDLEALCRSGLLAIMSNPALRVLIVIRELRDENGEAALPYRTLARKTGIRSDTTIKRAIDELKAIHLLNVRKTKPTGVLEAQSIYSLTPDEPLLLDLMRNTYAEQRQSISEEIEYRQSLKRSNRKSKARASLS